MTGMDDDERPKASVSGRRVLRRALAYLLLGGTLLAATLWPLYATYEDGLEATVLAAEKGHLELADNLLRAELREIGNDVRELANLPQIIDYLDTQKPELRAAIARRFEGFAQTYQRYDQIRLIGLDGQELIRINHRRGTSEVVPQSALQNKADRYYFRDALALDPDEVYVSPLDLNIEQGRVEAPHVPMMRLATLIRDATGQRRAMVVLNYRAGTMLEAFRLRVTSSGHTVGMIVNQSGQFLCHPDRQREWGWMLGRPEDNVQRLLPRLAPAVDSARDGHVRDASGVYLLRSVVPRLAVADGQAEARSLQNGERWTLIAFVQARAWQRQSPVASALGAGRRRRRLRPDRPGRRIRRLAA